MYRQCFGIPMATDCASLLANLSCFYFYEYRYIMRNKNNIYMARRFINTMRYIDDLLVMNLIRQFRTYLHPFELQLQKAPIHTPTKTYHGTMEHNYSTTLYDKRDDYCFDIVNFPYMSSNISSKPACGVCVSQLVRIGRICSSYGAGPLVPLPIMQYIRL